MPTLRCSASPSSVYRENNSSSNTTLSWSLSGLPSGATVNNVSIEMRLTISRSTNNYARVQNSSNNGIEYLREQNSGTYTTSSVSSSSISSITLTFRADTGVACTFSSFVAIIDYTPGYSKSTVSATNAVAGSNTTITISNSKLSSLSHKISIHLGAGDSGIISLGTGVGSYSYTIPASWLNYMANSSTGTGTVYCDTYNGGSLVGSSSTTFTVSAPASAGPSVTLATAPYGSTVPSSWGVYVQTLSGVTLTASPSTQYGATITTRTFSDGTPDGSNANIARVASLNTAGNNTFSVTVTDSRGFQASASQTINVLPYSSPSLNSISVVRCDSAGNTTDASGAPLETGTYVLASANVTFSSCNNHNSITIILDVELNGTWTAVASLTNNTEQVCSAPSSLPSGFDPATIYKFRISVTDALGQQTFQIAYLQSIMMVMHVRDDDSGIAFGMVSNRSGFEFRPDWDIYMYQKKIIDLIHPVGSVYISFDYVEPSVLFPGTTWERILGRFLLANGQCSPNTDEYFGTIKAPNTWSAAVGSTGGEDYHQLTTEEMPIHTHAPYGGNEHDRGNWCFTTLTYEQGWTGSMDLPTGTGIKGFATKRNWSSLGVRAHTAPAGGRITTDADDHVIDRTDIPHNNMPPYIGVNMWKRTA